MAKVKKTRFVILGFLIDGPRSGYDIGKMIARSTSNFWQESDASLYPTLKILKKEGLVTAETVLVGKRKKEIFSITAAGKEAFSHWFSLKPEKDAHREEFLLKLFFTDESTEKTMRKHCTERLQELLAAKKNYNTLAAFLKRELPEKAHWLQTLQLGIAHLNVDIAWLEKYGVTDATNNK
jgi:DNA-binding PadR family transcriptional regulator